MLAKRIHFILWAAAIGVFAPLAVFAFSSPNFIIDDVSFGDTPVLTASGGIAPPTITAVPSVTLKGLTAEIRWGTDRFSNSIVAFGLADTYGTEIGQFEESAVDHTVILKGLNPLTTYHFQVRSTDASNNTTRSSDRSFTTGLAPSISNVTISDITLTSAIVSWTTTTIATSALQYGKTLEYGSTITDTSSQFTTVHTVRLRALEIGTTYHLQVQGKDEGGLDLFSDDYAFATIPNPAVSNLVASNLNDHSADISWNTNIETDSFVEYGEPGSAKQTIGEAGSLTEHKISIDGLSQKTLYEYRIVGKDIFGNAVASAIGTFTTTPDTTSPQISRIRTESKVTNAGEGQSVQVLIAWDTDEASTSQIEYSEGVGKDSFELQTNLDANFVDNHVMVLTDIRTAAAYTFRVKSHDAAGNEGVSGRFVVLMPQRQQGVFEIIFGALQDAFSWLQNVGPYLFEVVTFKT